LAWPKIIESITNTKGGKKMLAEQVAAAMQCNEI
jgi:hypothetical protein